MYWVKSGGQAIGAFGVNLKLISLGEYARTSRVNQCW